MLKWRKFMDAKKVVKHFGGVQQTADAMVVSYPAVQQWVRSGFIPPVREWQVQVLTDGKFKAKPQAHFNTGQSKKKKPAMPIPRKPENRLDYLDGQVEMAEQMIRDLEETLRKLTRERDNLRRHMEMDKAVS